MCQSVLCAIIYLITFIHAISDSDLCPPPGRHRPYGKRRSVSFMRPFYTYCCAGDIPSASATFLRVAPRGFASGFSSHEIASLTSLTASRTGAIQDKNSLESIFYHQEQNILRGGSRLKAIFSILPRYHFLHRHERKP